MTRHRAHYDVIVMIAIHISVMHGYGCQTVKRQIVISDISDFLYTNNIQLFRTKLLFFFIFIVLSVLYLRLTRVHLNQEWWPDLGFDNLKNVLDENFGTHYSDVIMRASQITGGSLFNRLSRRISQKTPKLRVTGLCEGNPPVVSLTKGQ